jgi:glycosyltransferase involved in cell wall biosynthesis
MKMRLKLLTHPSSFCSKSMPRFADMVVRGMTARGHEVEAWTSKIRFGRLPVGSLFLQKWLGYVDEYLVYPRRLRKLVGQQPRDTLFVVTDQALAIWVPCLAGRPYVIHCHDFIALKSALGEFPENPIGWTGRHYQRLIRNGFSHGNAFISDSQKTQSDLHRLLGRVPKISEAVHIGLNHPFQPMALENRLALLGQAGTEIPEHGFIVHVSGYQWYKNPAGVLEIYRAYAASHPRPAPLWMIGAPPPEELSRLAASIPSPGQVRFLTGFTNEQVNAAYAHARVLLFPSLEEGFGWPIVEAMASECPVITTDAAPMTEIAGETARLIPRMPANRADQKAWASSAARIVDELVRLNGSDRANLLQRGKMNAARFATAPAIEAYENIYSRVISD